jgi:hypothetical protein
MKQRTAAFVFLAVAAVLTAVGAAWCQDQKTSTASNPAQPAGASQTPQAIAQPATPLHFLPAPVILEPQHPGRWTWDPVTGTWYWELLVAPQPYVVYSYPYWPAYWYPHWIISPQLRGRYTFTPNPNFDKTIYGMLFLPPKEPPMAFQPGVSPAFPWAWGKPAQAQNQANDKARPSQPSAVPQSSDEGSQSAPGK